MSPERKRISLQGAMDSVSAAADQALEAAGNMISLLNAGVSVGADIVKDTSTDMLGFTGGKKHGSPKKAVTVDFARHSSMGRTNSGADGWVQALPQTKRPGEQTACCPSLFDDVQLEQSRANYERAQYLLRTGRKWDWRDVRTV